jgi:hypothetical protein
MSQQPQPQAQPQVCLNVNQLECLIAAILTVAAAGEDVDAVVRRYADIYIRLQANGHLVVQATAEQTDALLMRAAATLSLPTAS